MLSGIWDGIVGVIVDAVNGLLAALAAVLQGLFDLLPDLPALPEPPDALILAESWVAWVVPVGTILDILTFTLAMWLLWQAVAIVLRWAKATDA
jgi:hypothetical protein